MSKDKLGTDWLYEDNQRLKADIQVLVEKAMRRLERIEQLNFRNARLVDDIGIALDAMTSGDGEDAYLLLIEALRQNQGDD